MTVFTIFNVVCFLILAVAIIFCYGTYGLCLRIYNYSYMDILEYQRTVLRPLVEELEKLYPTPSPKESSPDLPIMAIEVGNKFYILNQKTQELNEASLFPTTEDDSKQKYVLKRCIASTEEEKEEAAKLECVLKIIIGKQEYHVYDKQYLKIFKNL